MFSRNDVKDMYSLSPMQEGMLFHYIMDEHNPAYFEQVSYRVSGEINHQLVEQAFNVLIQRYDVLRTVFIYKTSKKPVQVVLKQREAWVYFEDISYLPEAEKLGWIEAFKQKDREKEFDLSKDLLIRYSILKIAPGSYEITWSFHHIIMDGWCTTILIREMLHIIECLQQGNPINLPTPPPYSTYIKWLEEQDKEEGYRYWQRYLDNFENKTGIPKVASGKESQYERKEYCFTINKELLSRLNGVAHENKVTMNTVFQACWGILLQGYNNTHDVVFGSVVSGRPPHLPGIEAMVGLFINTIPLRVKNEPGKRFPWLLREVQVQTLQSQKYEYIPLADIQANSYLKRNLLDHIFVYENYPVDKAIKHINQKHDLGFSVSSVDLFEQTNYDFNVLVVEGEEFTVKIQYNPVIYNTPVIKGIATHLQRILEQVALVPRTRLRRIQIITEEEKNRILFDFNQTDIDYPHEKPLYQLFAEQVERTPDRVALVTHSPGRKTQAEERRSALFYRGPTGDAMHYALSYKELNEKSQQLAYLLRQKGVTPDTIVGVMLERSIEMIIAIFGILKAGGAYLPFDPECPEERVSYMLKDSNTSILVTNGEELERRSGINEKIVNGELSMVNCQWESVVKNRHTCSEDTSSSTCPVSPANLAYIIYTSGTTGKPKGTLITQHNVVRLLFNEKFQFDFNSNDTWTLFHSYCFDFSVWEMYGALLYGGKLRLIPRMTAVDTQEFLEILATEKVTVLNQTPSAFYNLANLEVQVPHKHLHLKYVIFGGEALKLAKLQQWKEKYPETRLINMFGITETTVHVTYKEVEIRDIQLSRSNIGRPIPTLYTYIMDGYQRLLPIGIPGEICVGGEGVARGYLNRPQLTSEKFVKHPYIPGQRLYRSGDLGRLLENGDMEYLGRIDHQVKIRGHRIELGEIESILSKHENIKESVVTATELARDEMCLCAYIVSHNELDTPALREYLSRELPLYMIPSYFVRLETIPLTVNGKVNRNVLPKPGIASTDLGRHYTAPRNEKEQIIASIWSKILRKEKIGIYDNFFAMGGHSLKAMSIISRINKELEAKLAVSDLFDHPTIAGLMGVMSLRRQKKYPDIEKCPEARYYELSHSQKRLWFFDQMAPGNPAYHITLNLCLRGHLDIEAFEQALNKLVQRHESLRTSIHMMEEGEEKGKEGVPVQVVHENAALEIYQEDISGTHGEERQEKLGRLLKKAGVTPFDLARAPLFRAALLKLGPREHAVVFVMHHIISDAWSIRVMIEEFTYYYNQGKPKTDPVGQGIQADGLPPLTLHYKDFAYWQNQLLSGDALTTHREYWLQKLAGELPVLDLPYDYPSPPSQNAWGDKVTFLIDGTLTRRLKHLSRRIASTLFMILMAGFKVLLYRYTRQEDIIIGTLTAGRSTAELEKIVGYFVNIFALRDRVDSNQSFTDFLGNLRKSMLEALDHQDYPFDKLVEELKLKRDTGRTPVFDIMMVFQNHENLELKSPLQSLEIKLLGKDYVVNKYDLYLDMTEMPHHVKVDFEFRVELFKKESIQRMKGHYLNLLKSIARTPDQLISALDILSEAETRQLLEDFNNTRRDIPRNRCFHRLFERQVEESPGRIAVKHNGRTATYQELNELANQVGHYLVQHGVTPNSMVGLLMKRSIHMLAAIIGVFKAGAAYLPIEVDYPEERVHYMLRDAETSLVVVDQVSASPVSQLEGVLYLEPGSTHLGQYPRENLTGSGTPDHYAYMIYTSGTTGKPKGVLVHQLGMINHLYAKINDLAITGNDRVAHTASPCFDISLWQFLAALLKGGTTVIFDHEVVLNPETLLRGLQEEQITIFESVPSLMSVFLEMVENSVEVELPHLRWMIPTGEALKPSLVQRWFKYYPWIQLVNAYGPTEASDDITHYKIASPADIGEFSVPIGKPVQNMRIYILDQYLSLCPVGVRGEICVAGIGVGKGYWKDPAKTKKAFVPNPHAWGPADKDYAILYKTGDIGYFREDGHVECLGRIDNQVKIRGFRIELEEIETVMLQHPRVIECAAVVKQNEEKEDIIAAFLKEKQTIDIEEYKQFLLEYLPPYMIPSAFVKLEEFPLSISGKVDRQMLAAMNIDATALSHGGKENYVTPRTSTEQQISQVWSEVLGIEHFGIHDNFFNIGGHSLLMPRIFWKLEKLFATKLQMADLFDYMTIQQLAMHIDGTADDEEDEIIELEF
jgi:amino acid adenylation domain-containing protein